MSIADFTDMMADTVDIQPGVLDDTGAFIPSGALMSGVQCYIESGPEWVVDLRGREVVSHARVFPAQILDLQPRLVRITLPSRFSPRLNLEPIKVDKPTDENGAHHEVIIL